VALRDALLALCEFTPPGELPPCDLGELASLLEAHGLAPLASYHAETHVLGASLPMPFRERLLAGFQGAINDIVFRMVTLKGLLRRVDVPVVLLGGAAGIDWLYPHLAFRPIGDLRLAVRGEDGARFAEAISGDFQAASTGPGGHTAVFGDGRIDLVIQEGLAKGSAEDHGLFGRRVPFPAMGPTAARPAPEDALLATVADAADLGLHAPLLLWIDLRELLRLPELGEPERTAAVRERAAAAGLDRALHGALALTAHHFPAVAARAGALAPELSRAERVAVDAVVESARDPARLRALRGEEAASRLVVAPRGA